MNNIMKINELIKELKEISSSEETPYMVIDGDRKSFNKGWYLCINRILNSLEKEK